MHRLDFCAELAFLVWKDGRGKAYEWSSMPVTGAAKFGFCAWVNPENYQTPQHNFWHIRPVNPASGLFPTGGMLMPSQGGIDTKGLCGWPKPKLSTTSPYGGQDIMEQLSEMHLMHSCEICGRMFIFWLRRFGKAVPERMAEAIAAAETFPDFKGRTGVEVWIREKKYSIILFGSDPTAMNAITRKLSFAYKGYKLRTEVSYTGLYLATGVPRI